jgi:hypothetical protein
MIVEMIDNEEKLYKGIGIAFHQDYDLINQYHVVEKGTYEQCVDDTFNKIIEATEELPLEWYLLRSDNREIIGYCVVSKAYNFLYSFGINKNHRTSYNLTTWFFGITELLQNNFVCGLWAKNKRAIDFLCRNGMEIFKKEENIIHLKYN